MVRSSEIKLTKKREKKRNQTSEQPPSTSFFFLCNSTILHRSSSSSLLIVCPSRPDSKTSHQYHHAGPSTHPSIDATPPDKARSFSGLSSVCLCRQWCFVLTLWQLFRCRLSRFRSRRLCANDFHSSRLLCLDIRK